MDGAHNPDKISSTVKAMQGLKLKSNLFLIVGFSNDKNIKVLVHHLAKLEPKVVFCTRNTVNPFRKVASPQKIQQLFRAELPQNKNIFIRLDPIEAWEEALAEVAPDDMIIVTGSIFLSGEIRGLI